MEIYNCKEISIINQENTQLKMKNELLMKAIAQLEIENKKKDLIAMQLTKSLAELNIKLSKMEGK